MRITQKGPFTYPVSSPYPTYMYISHAVTATPRGRGRTSRCDMCWQCTREYLSQTTGMSAIQYL